MAQAMTIDVPTSVNFFWTGATLTSGLGVYPWSFDEDDSRHGLFCANYTFPGSDGTFSEGITGVHEVGHYFGLHHTFENGCSNPGDEVDDTPYQSQPNYGCPSNNYSCGSYDDIGNFMDYMDDDCLDHFTDGQVDRIEWALETYRPTLLDGEDYEGPVWHIATTGSDSTGDGSEENPFATIQAGIDAAFDGDTVLVSAGTYVENITWSETYGIKLIGSGENQCIIDGDSLDSVIRFEWGLNEGTIDENTLITGFTIQNGNAHVEEYPYYHGGGIFFANGCSATLTNLNISNNSASHKGGGIFCNHSSNLTLNNVLIANNLAGGGGGYYSGDSNPNLFNVTIFGNVAHYDSGGGIWGFESDLTLINSILWDNSPQEIKLSPSSSITVTYSDIQGGWEGEGNIDSDPLFCAPDSGDYSLAENSPCAGTGQDGANMGAFDVDCESILASDYEIIPTKFALHPPYPNPFNPTTTIQFDLVETWRATSLRVFDITGRVVGVLVNGRMVTGEYEVQWNASQHSSGIYFVELVAGEKRDVQKLILLK